MKEIELHPEEAKVGADIRVVGNNAGEKLTILGGTLARLDRNAPVYGSNTYNDFNTSYYQAASSTSGGSSGSPVLNAAGHCIALNAGGRRGTAASFFLPLHRVVRALECLRKGTPVSRGTLQTTLIHRPFHELQQFGLTPELETLMREAIPSGSGMLVVDSIMPGAPTEGKLQPGDSVLRINGSIESKFENLEAIIDESLEPGSPSIP